MKENIMASDTLRYYMQIDLDTMYKKKKLLDKQKMKGTRPPEEYYVYLVQRNNMILYIGKGKDWRFLHPNSGTSSVIEFNKGHFDGHSYDVYLMKMYLTESEALDLETALIWHFEPLYNKRKQLFG